MAQAALGLKREAGRSASPHEQCVISPLRKSRSNSALDPQGLNHLINLGPQGGVANLRL